MGHHALLFRHCQHVLSAHSIHSLRHFKAGVNPLHTSWGSYEKYRHLQPRENAECENRMWIAEYLLVYCG